MFKIVFVVLLVCILYYLMYDRLEWANSGEHNPYKRYTDVVKEFGQPDIIDRSSGGVAVWKKSTLTYRGHCWDRVEIHDEQIPHDDPAPHVDFLYTWCKIDVPEDKISSILSISDSVTYDPLKKLVRARCHFHGANVATLLLVKRVVTGEMSIKEARNKYGDFIFSTVESSPKYDPEAYNSYVAELCDYVKK